MKARRSMVALLGILSLLAFACAYLPNGAGPAATVGPQPTSGSITPQPAGNNPFGVMVPAQVAESAQGMALVQQLGVVYFRPPQAIFVDQWNGSCTACDLAQQAGLKLVLTVRNGGGGLGASSPPQDLAAYQKTLGEILDKYHPAVLAVENEENSAIFYNGTPQQYGAELQAACEVAHSKGVKCTNGGMVSALAALVAWDHLQSSGDAAQAQDFASRAFDPSLQGQLKSAQAQAQIDKGKQLLDAYKAAGIDYLNFHWYIGDTKALDVAVGYLRTQVSVPLITNEVGQFNEDPGQTTAVMGALVKDGIPIIIWFGMDGPKARGLMDTNGSLRSTGQAFEAFIRQNYTN